MWNPNRLILKGLNDFLQGLITKGLSQVEKIYSEETIAPIVKKGLSFFKQYLVKKGFDGNGIVPSRLSIITKGLSSLGQLLCLKGYDGVGVTPPPTPRRHGGTVVGISVGLSVGMTGAKEFEEELVYQCKAEIHKPIENECLIFGSKSFESKVEATAEGQKAFAVTQLKTIIAQTQHLSNQVLNLKGRKVFDFTLIQPIKAEKQFDSKVLYNANASRKFNTNLTNLIKASRIQNTKLNKITKGKRDLFPILFAAVDTYNEIFTDEIEV